MRTILSLLSEQPIPNLLFIRHIGLPEDQHIFISTSQMEERFKSQNLAVVLGLLPENNRAPRVVKVEPYNPENILSVLDEIVASTKTDEWIINITGGTKVMSQMVFTVFSEYQNATIYYWPDTNDRILELHPYVKEIPIANTPLINLSDYLRAHGFSYTHLLLEKNQYEAEHIWNMVLQSGDVRKVPLLQRARSDDYKNHDKPYLTGGWFEEWLFYRLKNRFNLNDNHIGLSVEIHDINGLRPDTPSRELDIVYVHNHQLYVLEAKVYSITAIKTGVIMKDLFKLSAIRQMLGLKAQASYAIAGHVLNDVSRRNTLSDLCKALNINSIYDINSLQKF